jgi:hypothetical protein
MKQLLHDAMILARAKGYDVFNALDLLQVGGRVLVSQPRVLLPHHSVTDCPAVGSCECCHPPLQGGASHVVSADTRLCKWGPVTL